MRSRASPEKIGRVRTFGVGKKNPHFRKNKCQFFFSPYIFSGKNRTLIFSEQVIFLGRAWVEDSSESI